MKLTTKESLESIAQLVFLCGAVIVGVIVYNYYATNRTARVQEVHQVSSSNQDCIDASGLSALSFNQPCFELYMNDGTVWMVGHAFPVIARDEIRYQSPGSQVSSSGADDATGTSICVLVNITRNALIVGKRINGPKANTSCPAD